MRLLVGLFFILSSLSSYADERQELWIDVGYHTFMEYELYDQPSFKKYKVFVEDQITDGCWSSPDASKNAVALELKRSEKLADEDIQFFNSFLLSGFGGELSGVCVAVVSLQLNTQLSGNIAMGFNDDWEVTKEINTSVNHWYEINKSILTGPADSMSNRIREWYSEKIQSYLLASNKNAVEEIKKEVQEQAAEHYPENKEEWVKLIN